MSAFSKYFRMIFCHNFISARFVFKGGGSSVLDSDLDLFLFFFRVRKGTLHIGDRSYSAGDVAVVSLYPGISVSFRDVSVVGFLFPYYKLSDDNRFDVFGGSIDFKKENDMREFISREAGFCNRNFDLLSKEDQVIYVNVIFNKLDLCLANEKESLRVADVRLAKFFRIIIKNGYRYNLKDFCEDLSLGHSTIYRATVRYGGYRRLKEFVCLKSVLYELFQSSRSSYYNNIIKKYGFDDVDFFEDRFIRRFGVYPDRIYGNCKWSDTEKLIQRREFIERLLYL